MKLNSFFDQTILLVMEKYISFLLYFKFKLKNFKTREDMKNLEPFESDQTVCMKIVPYEKNIHM